MKQEKTQWKLFLETLSAAQWEFTFVLLGEQYVITFKVMFRLCSSVVSQTISGKENVKVYGKDKLFNRKMYFRNLLH